MSKGVRSVGLAIPPSPPLFKTATAALVSHNALRLKEIRSNVFRAFAAASDLLP